MAAFPSSPNDLTASIPSPSQTAPTLSGGQSQQATASPASSSRSNAAATEFRIKECHGASNTIIDVDKNRIVRH
jgi:hypothetical protein